MENKDCLKYISNCEKKKRLTRALKEIEIINDDSICTIIIEIYKGGIRDLDRKEKMFVN